jgi:hypothetical protein
VKLSWAIRFSTQLVASVNKTTLAFSLIPDVSLSSSDYELLIGTERLAEVGVVYLKSSSGRTETPQL